MEIHQMPVLLASFDNTIDKWITYLNDYTLSMLCQKPQPDAWSLGQVYMHLIADTRYFIGEIEAALRADTTNSSQPMHPDAQVLFAQNGFPDSAFSNPSNDPHSPQPESKEMLQQSLLQIKEDLHQCCATADFSRPQGKTQHPGLGFFQATEWLQFAEMHMRHHFRQKKRIDALLFPSLQP